MLKRIVVTSSISNRLILHPGQGAVLYRKDLSESSAHWLKILYAYWIIIILHENNPIFDNPFNQKDYIMIAQINAVI